MATDLIAFQAKVGGRWAVSWQGWLLGAPFAVMITYFGAPAIATADSWLVGAFTTIFVGVSTYLAAGLVLWTAAKTVLRHRTRSPLSVQLLAVVGGLAWAARSGAIIAYLDVQGLPDEIPWIARAATAFIEGAIAVVLAAWFLGSLEEFHRRRQRLLEQLVQVELASEGLAASIRDLRADLLRRVRQSVTDSMSRLTVPSEGEPPSGDQIRSLDEVTETVARRISHDLWRRANRKSRLRPLLVIRSATSFQPFVYWGLIPTLALALIVMPMFWPPLASVALAVTTTTAILGIAIVSNHTIPRMRPGSRVAAYACVIVLLAVASFVIARIGVRLTGIDGPSAAVLPWMCAIDFAVLFPLIGLGAATGRARGEVLDELRTSISKAEVYREALRADEERVCRELALALHGSTQARLTAARIRLRLALDQGDFMAAREALIQAKQAALLDGYVSDESCSNVREMLDGLADAWSGVLSITSSVDTKRSLNSHEVKLVMDVLVESITNAVRHANATHIDITVLAGEDLLRLVVADNGRVAKVVSPGLGSALLDSIAARSWTLAPRPEGGSILTVDIHVPTIRPASGRSGLGLLGGSQATRFLTQSDKSPRCPRE